MSERELDAAFCVSSENGYYIKCVSLWLEKPTKSHSGYWVKPGNEAMQTRSSASASADLVPLRIQFPAGHRREAQLQIVDPTSFRGKVLPGWTVVNRPRSSTNGSVDTVNDLYRDFRLWIVLQANELFSEILSQEEQSLHLELEFGIEECVRSLMSSVQWICMIGIKISDFVSHSSCMLLERVYDSFLCIWFLGYMLALKKKLRVLFGKVSPFLFFFVGKCYIEPGTGRQFPSLESVHRHLTGEVDDRRLTRAGGAFFKDQTRVYEGSRTKQVH